MPNTATSSAANSVARQINKRAIRVPPAMVVATTGIAHGVMGAFKIAATGATPTTGGASTTVDGYILIQRR